jgi:hypothetical protein
MNGWLTAIRGTYMWQSVLYNVQTGSGSNGLELVGQSANNIVDGCLFVSNNAAGSANLKLTSDGGLRGEGLVVSNSLLFGANYGVYAPGPGFLSLHLDHNIIDFASVNGLYIAGVDGLRATGNWIYSTGPIAIVSANLGAPTDLHSSITGNYISSTAGYGIWLGANNQGFSASDNTISYGGAAYGVYLELRSSGNSFIGNRLVRSGPGGGTGFFMAGVSAVILANTGDSGVAYYAPAAGRTMALGNEGQGGFIKVAPGIPVLGTWKAGDVILNSSPTASGIAAWICTAGGTPGTWVAIPSASDSATGWQASTITATASIAVGGGAPLTTSNQTGIGSIVLATSPTLTTPNIGNAIGSISGNAATATSLAADPADCSGSNFAIGINAAGVAQCAQPAFSNLSGTATSSQLPTAELLANRNAASGYAGLTADAKLNVTQGWKVWGLADLMDVTATTGNGSTVMLNEVPVLKSYRVADLPAAGTQDRIAIVTDAATAGSCTSGDGDNRSLCRDTGSAWEPLGDGGGGGGSNTKPAVSSSDSSTLYTAQVPRAVGTLVGTPASLDQDARAPSNLSNVRLVGPGGYATIQEALNSLPNTTPPDIGGTIQVTPNYSETLTSGIFITTENTTIEFLGPAVLRMGTNSIQIAPGLRNVVIRGPLPWGGYSGSVAPAVTLDYQGGDAAIQVGGLSALTENVVVENLNFSLAQAGENASAIDAIYLQRYQFNSIRINGSARAAQIGIRIQGGSAPGHWSGSGVISLPYILMHAPGSIGVQYSSLGSGPTNQNEIRGGTILGTLNSSSIGVNYAASGSSGNTAYSLAITGFQQGVHYSAGNVGNALFGGTFKNNGMDIQFDAGANTNEVHGTNGGNGGILRATDRGINNIVWSGGIVVSGFLTIAK